MNEQVWIFKRGYTKWAVIKFSNYKLIEGKIGEVKFNFVSICREFL